MNTEIDSIQHRLRNFAVLELAKQPVSHALMFEAAEMIDALNDDVPEGYQLVLVPKTKPGEEPDWDECVRQAEVVTGLKVERHTMSIIIREARRWLAHRQSTQPYQPVKQQTTEPEIPSNVHYDIIADNFYDDQNKYEFGMGNQFYEQWKDRRDEFRQHADDPTVEGIDWKEIDAMVDAGNSIDDYKALSHAVFNTATGGDGAAFDWHKVYHHINIIDDARERRTPGGGRALMRNAIKALLRELAVDAQEQCESLDHQKQKAEKFALQHAVECAREIIEWQDTALLRDGKLRQLAGLCKFAGHTALNVAQRIATRAALDALVVSNTVYR